MISFLNVEDFINSIIEEDFIRCKEKYVFDEDDRRMLEELNIVFDEDDNIMFKEDDNEMVKKIIRS